MWITELQKVLLPVFHPPTALILQELKAGRGEAVTGLVLTGERQKRVVRLSPVTKMRMKTPASKSDSSREH